jgi:hypothetical protein
MYRWTLTSRRSLHIAHVGTAHRHGRQQRNRDRTGGPLSGVLASTGEQMGLGGQIYDGLHGMTLGSRFVEVTLIGGAGKLMR